jgi:threonine synthase
MIAVQMAGCAPIVTAYKEGEARAAPVSEAKTRCWGLRVPSPFADREVLQVLLESRGTAIAVAEDDLLPASRLAARNEGIDLSPEGAAAVAALPRLLAAGDVLANDRIVVLNTAQSSLYK